MSILKCTVALIGVVVTLALGLVAVTAAVQEPPSIPHGSVNELMEKLASSSADERKEAREGLLALGAAAVPTLILATESDSALLRWEAVNLLGVLGDLRGTEAVLRVAMTDPDVHARWRANWAITVLDDGTVIPRLIAALCGEDTTVAWNAAVTLSLFDRQEAVPLLHQGLEASDWQQWAAVNALGRVWNDETASKLIVLLQGGSEGTRLSQLFSRPSLMTPPLRFAGAWR